MILSAIFFTIDRAKSANKKFRAWADSNTFEPIDFC